MVAMRGVNLAMVRTAATARHCAAAGPDCASARGGHTGATRPTHPEGVAMPSSARFSHRRPVAWFAALLLFAVSACAALPAAREPLRINVADIDAEPGEGFELRLLVKLRVQNPNDVAVDYEGAVIDVDVNGKNLASGVSGAKGSVPRFGETVLTVPVTVSAFSAVRQAIDGFTDGKPIDKVPYVLRGKLSTGAMGSVPFNDEGTLKWPGSKASAAK
jgi:LEA14-like dessication related protein